VPRKSASRVLVGCLNARRWAWAVALGTLCVGAVALVLSITPKNWHATQPSWAGVDTGQALFALEERRRWGAWRVAANARTVRAALPRETGRVSHWARRFAILPARGEGWGCTWMYGWPSPALYSYVVPQRSVSDTTRSAGIALEGLRSARPVRSHTEIFDFGRVLPTQIVVTGYLINLAVYSPCIYLVLGVATYGRKVLRRRRNQCERCGYPRCFLPEGRCPECGYARVEAQ
jgi:hypothetical protein